MTEKELLKLGFTKESGADTIEDELDFYYYVKDITNGLCFITNGSDETIDDHWYVEFFDTEIPIRYCDYSTVKELFTIIEEGIIKNKTK